ncbi:hypothetical protein ACFQZ4_42765 [Catellatospora coxensis]
MTFTSPFEPSQPNSPPTAARSRAASKPTRASTAATRSDVCGRQRVRDGQRHRGSDRSARLGEHRQQHRPAATRTAVGARRDARQQPGGGRLTMRRQHRRPRGRVAR